MQSVSNCPMKVVSKNTINSANLTGWVAYPWKHINVVGSGRYVSSKPDKITRYDLLKAAYEAEKQDQLMESGWAGKRKHKKRTKVTLETISEENSSNESLF
ncbi:YLR346C [Saccharomyces arboricola H-6]|uniref:YLR346C n=1 Tax=Saccharomyces arboricola (strain H-6 / AS 2.3317 / CBS 10644) TaxID=1160507 RepID=J8Q1R4_SACAR|nr:YLR346C [Saccharomyces arboricola H-6]